MPHRHKTPRRSAGFGLASLAVSTAALLGLTVSAGVAARAIFLQQPDQAVPVLAGSALDDMPALMRGSLPIETLSSIEGRPMRERPPRMCEMPEDYFETMPDARPAADQVQVGYTARNEYVSQYSPRRGFLDEREMRAAEVAWHYFETYTQEETGLANSVGNYPSTTMWDTASYVSGMVAAYELCLIEKPEFDRRAMQLLTTLKGLDLFRGEMPNKVYHTRTGEKVNYTNRSGEIGFSALDIGRFLVWMRILKHRYPYLGNSIDAVLLKWDFSNIVDEEGLLIGAYIDKETNETVYAQEGRLGYEEYAAKGFALWGFRPLLSHRAEPYLTASIFGVPVPYDGRDPRLFHSQNYVVTESYLLDGLELGFDLPHDDITPDWLHSDGWRAEFADRIYEVQEARWQNTGFMTARSEHNVSGPPYFTYDTIFSDGYPWNTVSPRGDYVPDHAAIAAKAAIGLWSLWDTDYTDVLFDAIIESYDPERGMYEGLYERGQGRVEIFTANNNGIILAGLLHKVQGTLLTPYEGGSEVWFTAYRESTIRETRNYPDPPRQEDWLPALRHSVRSEAEY
ncbi:DUF3131 domain-containing protein [Pseudoroseicyclus aestuarii]|uniref:Uncharacterized protein DUF3131 n=1 Tax=Pseudoroseicyclus aestuarii TaxID=1795041 RepID=A0A318T057_9RHOB|nr:DUF3131 domain-containing protein [Pseudoroseicyclus aestuarii]PYE85999.1 uncharacterized protein DUF3131 [Pseudoroseicyclus aestuarii]